MSNPPVPSPPVLVTDENIDLSLRGVKEYVDAQVLSSSGSPTDITSTTLDVGGTDYDRTVDLTSAQLTALGKAGTAVQPADLVDGPGGNSTVVTNVTNIVNAILGELDYVKSATYNSTTGALTFTKEDDTTLVVNIPIGLAAVAASGSYTDLDDKPTIPALANLGVTTSAFSQAISHGSATTAARSDHRHPLPAGVGPVVTTTGGTSDTITGIWSGNETQYAAVAGTLAVGTLICIREA